MTLQQVAMSLMSLMYKANRHGDKTPPCLIPRNKQCVSEYVEHYRTHVIQVLNQFSVTQIKSKSNSLSKQHRIFIMRTITNRATVS